ncbi:hypothetical protein [Streptomyces sp. NPDC096013]|uniref:hypothetical protein n=1 Tax=Streptomyces sp. NPDC096013 TaxID=3366069 RepID=UPI003812DBE5
MIALLLVALLVLALIAWRAMDKAAEADVIGIIRCALAAIVTLVPTYVAMRAIPPEAVPEVLQAALRAFKSA